MDEEYPRRVEARFGGRVVAAKVLLPMAVIDSMVDGARRLGRACGPTACARALLLAKDDEVGGRQGAAQGEVDFHRFAQLGVEAG
jgi:hypothetical protein